MHRLGPIVLAPLALVALVAAGCSGDSESATPVSSSAGASPTGVYEQNTSLHPTTYGTLGAGYPTDVPAPGSTFSPSPQSWADVRPPDGFSVTMLVPAGDPPAGVVLDAVRSWAAEDDVTLDVVTVATPADDVTQLSAAIAAAPDLIITSGNSLVDPMALVTASAAQQRFLILGGEIAEPTFNVTAVDWVGAGFKGEGLGQAPDYDPSTFTTERADRAIRAGVAATLTNWTGFVVYLP